MKQTKKARKLPRLDVLIRGVSLLLISSGIALFICFGVTEREVAQTDLNTYWRTSYDILVRPTNSPDFLDEAGERLLEPNHLSGQKGGISLEQYQTIQSIEGVKVAAPIAYIGYFPVEAWKASTPVDSQQPNATWVIYKMVRTYVVSDGARVFTTYEVFYEIHDRRDSYQIDDKGHRLVSPDGKIFDLSNISLRWGADPDEIFIQGKEYSFDQNGNPAAPGIGNRSFSTNFLIAGIDPQQENALVGLESTLVEGRYFLPEEKPYLKESQIPGFDQWIVPVIFNGKSYREMTMKTQIYTLAIPPEDEMPKLLAKEGKAYLERLDEVLIAENTYDLADRVQYNFADSLGGEVGINLGGAMWSYTKPSPVKYIALTAQPDYPLVFEAVPVNVSQHSPTGRPFTPAEVSFRTNLPGSVNLYSEDGLYGLHFSLMPLGIFEMENSQETVNLVPMESYFPPLATLRYDENGNPTESVTIHPTDNPTGYLSDTPALFTNLEGAHFLAQRDDFISAVRVQVSGIDKMGEDAQRKIEKVASEIETQTGLKVYITLGSSPQSVLVKIPGYKEAPALGSVEELWVRQLVGITLQRNINQADGLLFGMMFLVSGLHIFSNTTISTLRRQRELALYKAVGWEKQYLFRALMKETMGIATISGLVAALISYALISILDLNIPISRLAITFIVALPLYLIGSVYPAWKVSISSPDQMVRAGEVRHSGIHLRNVTFSKLGLYYLLRKPERTLLSFVILVITTSMIGIFLLGSLAEGGNLEGSLLGQKIAISVQPYHFVLTFIMFALTDISIFQSAMLNFLERQSEIGLLKTLGWENKWIIKLFTQEGIYLGIAGGLVAIPIMILFYWGVYHTVTLQVVLISAGIALLAIILTAICVHLPASRAAKLSPSDALRK